MATKKRKIKKVTKDNGVGDEQRKVTGYARRVVFWRYTEDGSDKKVKDNVVYRGYVPAIYRHRAFVQAQIEEFRWMCLSITYYRDHQGRVYKRIGEARSPAIQAELDGIRPTIEAAFINAEDKGNDRQIFARGCIFAPKSGEFPSLHSVAVDLRRELKLTDHDLETIAALELEEPTYYEYDRDEVFDLDRQLARLL